MVTNGEVSVLNVNAGDLKLSFNSKNPIEVEQARQVVRDMLHRGYLLFAYLDDQWVRIREFDDKTDEYLVAWGPAAPASSEPPTQTYPNGEPEPPARRPGRPKGSKKRVPARSTNVTGVAPTAGG